MQHKRWQTIKGAQTPSFRDSSVTAGVLTSSQFRSRTAHGSLTNRVTILKTKSSREKIMAKRTASAVWEGTLREGKGTVKLGSGAY